MAVTWKIEIDWEQDGTFDAPHSEVSSRVMMASWFLGMHEPYQATFDDSRLTLKLQNADRWFSPEYQEGPLFGLLKPNVPIRVKSHDGVVERVMWVGRIETIHPVPGIYSERYTEIMCAGPMQQLKTQEVNLALHEQARTDKLIRTLLLGSFIPIPKPGVWILGKSRLGIDTILADDTDIMLLEPGLVTLTMAADNWVQGGDGINSERKNFSVYRAIEDIVAAERGRFFFNREGLAVFWNREHLMTYVDPAAEFIDTMQGLEYQYGSTSDFHNEIIVTCHTRSISEGSNEVLWSLQEPLSLSPGQTQTLRAKYEDESGGRVAGRNLSFTYAFSSGSGLLTMDTRANQATIKVINTGGGTAVLSSCQVLGQKIVDAGRTEVVARDMTSQEAYGRRVHRINLSALSDAALAQEIADLELERRREPQGVVASLTMKSHALEGGATQAQQLSLQVGDLLYIKESQTGHEAFYWIIGEAHLLEGRAHETQWYLEFAPFYFLTDDEGNLLEDDAGELLLA